jgi:hypothetical protein
MSKSVTVIRDAVWQPRSYTWVGNNAAAPMIAASEPREREAADKKNGKWDEVYRGRNFERRVRTRSP